MLRNFSLTMVLTTLLITVSAQAKSKVLLISDIDDTIKVSHVLSTAAKISRAADVTTPFLGMSQLYQLIVNENSASTKVIYLSNAPDEIGGVPALTLSHQTFLNFNKFPAGELLLRDGLFEENHKLKAIRELVESEQPQTIIMIGDNGEQDSEIYEQIKNEYAESGIKMVTFIHQLYSSNSSSFIPDFLEERGHAIFPGQNGFATPIEISLQLNDLGLLSIASVDWMIKNIAPHIVAESSFKWDGLEAISFPSFKDCSDFQWSRPLLRIDLADLVKKIERRCN